MNKNKIYFQKKQKKKEIKSISSYMKHLVYDS